MLLIVIGGTGFLTWDDIYTNKLIFKRYRMQSKIILMTTAGLILFPTVFFFVCDLKNLSAGKRLLAAVFQSVTTRTAGFNTINISKMSEASKAVMILLMLVGGSPGSTAGGMKTTTFTVLILNAISKPGKCRGFWTKIGISCNKKCCNDSYALFYPAFLWWNRNQRI